MAFMITLSLLLIAGAVVGVVARRRTHRRHPSSGLSDLDAEVEANQWLVRLGGGLVPPDVRVWAGADEEAARALIRAAECHRAARDRLATARTAEEYGEATRMAREGLRQLRRARTALGLEKPPAADGPPPCGPSAGRGGGAVVLGEWPETCCPPVPVAGLMGSHRSFPPS
ncbi:hypothetical protein [Streptomyces sp. NPDC014995]|uniref:hypothetical protein n=1 Tax=Streptomyces sp. NPDC014995 TaxID=3364936 RepID=UPI0036FE2E06